MTTAVLTETTVDLTVTARPLLPVDTRPVQADQCPTDSRYGRDFVGAQIQALGFGQLTPP